MVGRIQLHYTRREVRMSDSERIRLFRAARHCVKTNPNRYKIEYSDGYYPYGFMWILFERVGTGSWREVYNSKIWLPKS